ncbi:hypothetical protein E4U13_006954 [Claviceps humidiphila]|uniref:Uncharacterized protein n=1 Tax=Claviceps humidiphila TaxID=1294629 RepID=A0A9P7Q5J3_9HYPO|nr:hypothetical protein E4U13_006954 [Claviceps humidiphila]
MGSEVFAATNDNGHLFGSRYQVLTLYKHVDTGRTPKAELLLKLAGLLTRSKASWPYSSSRSPERLFIVFVEANIGQL